MGSEDRNKTLQPTQHANKKEEGERTRSVRRRQERTYQIRTSEMKTEQGSERRKSTGKLNNAPRMLGGAYEVASKTMTWTITIEDAIQHAMFAKCRRLVVCDASQFAQNVMKPTIGIQDSRHLEHTPTPVTDGSKARNRRRSANKKRCDAITRLARSSSLLPPAVEGARAA